MADLPYLSPAELAEATGDRGAIVSPHAVAFESSVREAMLEDVSHIVRAAPWIERCPARMWAKEPGLFSELAEAVDKLAAKVGAVKEALGADR